MSFGKFYSVVYLSGLLALLAACGGKKNNAVNVASATRTLEAALRETESPAMRSAVRQSRCDGPAYWQTMITNYLNNRYGVNPAVDTVVLTGGQNSIYSNAVFTGTAGQTLFQKDANGQFQWISGNVLQLPVINYNPLLPFFYAVNVVPLAVAGSGLCAGTAGKSFEAASVTVGLAGVISKNTLAGGVSNFYRNGTSYQFQYAYCDASLNCNTAQTGPVALPPMMTNWFPTCDAILSSAVVATLRK